MAVRGERRCLECGRRWSYFDTESVYCPACGSPRSVSADDAPTRHTDSRTDLTLEPASDAFSTGDVATSLEEASDRTAAYLGERGFIRAGTLGALDETYVAAVEVRYAAGLLVPPLTPAVATYWGTLLEGAPSGKRPPADEIPPSVHGIRGLAAAATVRRYRRALTRTTTDISPEIRTRLEQVRNHAARIEALDGEVEPTHSEALLDAMRAIGEAVRDTDSDALPRADAALDRLSKDDGGVS